MITILSIEKKERITLFDKIKNFIYVSHPEVSALEYRGTTIVNIKFEQVGKKIPWKKIAKIAGDNKNKILCSENIIFPQDLDFKRFNSSSFMKKLCENAVFSILKIARLPQSKLKICLYDPRGIYVNILEKLLPFSSHINVMTDNFDFYSIVSEKLMDNYGASLIIRSLKSKADCDILVSPDKITDNINTNSSTLIFTSDKPCVSLKGITFFLYTLPIDPEYNRIFFSYNIDYEYFLSAVYEKIGKSGLNYLIPNYCKTIDQHISLKDVSKHIYDIII